MADEQLVFASDTVCEELKEFLLGLNPHIVELFGEQNKITISPVNPESDAYKEAGVRLIVVFPWPNVDGEKLSKLMAFVREATQMFAASKGLQSLGKSVMVTGGAIAYYVGMREKTKAEKDEPEHKMAEIAVLSA